MTMSPPRHRAAWNGEQRSLSSGDATLHLYRRTTGWGWGEFVDSDGTPIAVLDHFGEIALRDSPVPMRLEADTAEATERGYRFAVRSMTVRDALAGSSFERWVGSPFVGPVIVGAVEISADGVGGFDLSWQLESTADVYVEYLRGPWLTVGRTSFGGSRDDAILPGVEWARGREWTSGDDWFRDPWGMRATPPVDSVATGVMAVSRHGRRISLAWTPGAEATGWFSTRRERAQPVFASPNFIERNDSSLLGIMLPETRGGGGSWRAEEPLELHRGQQIVLDARIALGAGDSLDAVVEHVRRVGLPEPRVPDLADAVHAIAATYGSVLWHDGAGFGIGQLPGDVRARVPRFVTLYLERCAHTAEAARLREIAARIPEIDSAASAADAADARSVAARAEALLAAQQPGGGFVFDPDGRHRSKDDFVVARDLVAPMGLPGESALDLDVLPALELLRAFEATGDERFASSARAALDAARPYRRPEGGDFWETPLHAPNLLAAGHAAVAYAWAWRLFGDERDAVAARHWLRSLLVFTHLWEPPARPMLYNTKPCLCSSDWYFANWVRDHVQWEVIETIALAAEAGVDLASLDDDLDWDRYQRGVLSAGVSWLLDHREDTWRPHNLPETLDLYRNGRFDGCLPDTHNSTTGLYGGLAIEPGRLGEAIFALVGG